MVEYNPPPLAYRPTPLRGEELRSTLLTPLLMRRERQKEEFSEAQQKAELERTRSRDVRNDEREREDLALRKGEAASSDARAGERAALEKLTADRHENEADFERKQVFGKAYTDYVDELRGAQTPWDAQAAAVKLKARLPENYRLAPPDAEPVPEVERGRQPPRTEQPSRIADAGPRPAEPQTQAPPAAAVPLPRPSLLARSPFRQKPSAADAALGQQLDSRGKDILAALSGTAQTKERPHAKHESAADAALARQLDAQGNSILSSLAGPRSGDAVVAAPVTPRPALPVPSPVSAADAQLARQLDAQGNSVLSGLSGTTAYPQAGAPAAPAPALLAPGRLPGATPLVVRSNQLLSPDDPYNNL